MNLISEVSVERFLSMVLIVSSGSQLFWMMKSKGRFWSELRVDLFSSRIMFMIWWKSVICAGCLFRWSGVSV